MSGRRDSCSAYAKIMPAFSDFCEVLHTQAPRCLRVNTLRTEPAQIQASLVQQGIMPRLTCPRTTSCGDYLTHPNGLQEALLGDNHARVLTSALASIVLSPKAGERICDLWAAPGGKIINTAQLMGISGASILACS